MRSRDRLRRLEERLSAINPEEEKALGIISGLLEGCDNFEERVEIALGELRKGKPIADAVVVAVLHSVEGGGI